MHESSLPGPSCNILKRSVSHRWVCTLKWSGQLLEQNVLLDDEVDPAPAPAPARVRRSAPIAYIAFGIALVLVIIEGIAIYVASNGGAVAATTLGQVLVVLTALPFALGLISAIRGPHREWGIAAMVVAVVANPLILLTVLSFFGSL